MQWHGTICIVKVFLLSEREISPNYTGIFLDFVQGFGSYVKGLPKTKRCNSVAVTVSVRFRFGFGVYVKQPLFLKIRFEKPSILAQMTISLFYSYFIGHFCYNSNGKK